MRADNFELDDESGILGLFSAGGSGHKQALLALKSRLADSCPDLPFVTCDILHNALPSYLARLLTRGWDRAKAAGDVKKLTSLYSGTLFRIPRHRFADSVLFLPIFICIVRILWRHRTISKILDTQPLGTKAIVRAARCIAALTGRRITVTKVMTDLPTARARHFSVPSQRLNSRDLACYTLMTVPPWVPLEGDGKQQCLERQERFWNQTFGLSLRGGEVAYRHFPIRKPFLDCSNSSKQVTIHCNGEEKTQLLALASGCLEPAHSALSCILRDVDIIGLIALGSQAIHQATKAYLLDLIAVARQPQSFGGKICQLFIACGKETALFRDICWLLEELAPAIPTSLTIIPLGFQEAATMAQLKRSAHFGIYCAGGVTTMELSSVAGGQLFIHSSALPPYPESPHRRHRYLLSGIPLWEAGNAKHLVKEHAAQLVVSGRDFRNQVMALVSHDIKARSVR